MLALLLGRNIFNKPLLAAALLAYVFLAILNRGQLVALLVRSYSIVIFWIFFAASYLWTVVPKVTLDIILTQTAFMVLAFCITLRHSTIGFSGSLRIAALLLLPFVILFCLIFPNNSFSSAGLSAFYVHKNTFGGFMAVCALTLFFTPNRNKWHIGFGVVATGLLLGSLSKTSIALFIICCALLLVIDWWMLHFCADDRRLSMKSIMQNFVLILLLLGLVGLVIFRDELLDLLWANLPKTALTGRGTLWLVVMQQIRSNSLLGLGPGAFWQAGGASEITHTTLFQNDPYWVQRMISADGSYIDLVASLGVLGLALFLLASLDLYRRLFRSWQFSDSRLIFVLVTFVLLHAITESTLLYSTNILWLIFLLCYFRVAGYTVVSQKKMKVQG